MICSSRLSGAIGVLRGSLLGRGCEPLCRQPALQLSAPFVTSGPFQITIRTECFIPLARVQILAFCLISTPSCDGLKTRFAGAPVVHGFCLSLRTGGKAVGCSPFRHLRIHRNGPSRYLIAPCRVLSPFLFGEAGCQSVFRFGENRYSRDRLGMEVGNRQSSIEEFALYYCDIFMIRRMTARK